MRVRQLTRTAPAEAGDSVRCAYPPESGGRWGRISGGSVPLSEEEQRILHEMEQKLYEHDPGFRGRVEARARHSLAGRPMRWSVLIFVIGFVVLLVAFRSSTVIAVFGFLVMLFAALMFERSARHSGGRGDATRRAGKPTGFGEEFALIGKKLRSRFGRDR
jgi:Protein of unknown function (DUF3040)